MRPILLFAIAAVAASAVGVGALNNVIDLNVQQFGVGSEDIESPIDAASIDFEIELVEVTGQEPGDTVYKNLITGCSFHSEETIEDEDTNPNNNPKIICKLSDGEGNIIAEGSLELPAGYEGSDREIIPITELAYEGANDFRNVHDVHLIVVGQNPTVVVEEVAP